METFDLAPVCEKLAKQHQLNVIGLFGSRARGDASDYSDYDFFIMGNIDIEEEMAIEAELEEMLEHEVDVVQLGPDMDKFLAKNILNEAVIFHNVNQTFEVFYEAIETFFRENNDFIYFRKRDLLD